MLKIIYFKLAFPFQFVPIEIFTISNSCFSKKKIKNKSLHRSYKKNKGIEIRKKVWRGMFAETR